MAGISRDHALFKRYPLSGSVHLTTGDAPTPYQIYGGYGAFVCGTADLNSVSRLLAGEQMTPLQNADGRTLIGVWICDFTDASLGPHHELQVSIFVSRVAGPPISSHPLALQAAMLTRPDLLMMCHGLWNNTPGVVAYNRELLSLNARLSNSVIARDSRRMEFSVSEQVDGRPVCSGVLSASPYDALGFSPQAVQRMDGFKFVYLEPQVQ